MDKNKNGLSNFYKSNAIYVDNTDFYGYVEMDIKNTRRKCAYYYKLIERLLIRYTNNIISKSNLNKEINKYFKTYYTCLKDYYKALKVNKKYYNFIFYANEFVIYYLKFLLLKGYYIYFIQKYIIGKLILFRIYIFLNDYYKKHIELLKLFVKINIIIGKIVIDNYNLAIIFYKDTIPLLILLLNLINLKLKAFKNNKKYKKIFKKYYTLFITNILSIIHIYLYYKKTKNIKEWINVFIFFSNLYNINIDNQLYVFNKLFELNPYLFSIKDDFLNIVKLTNKIKLKDNTIKSKITQFNKLNFILIEYSKIYKENNPKQLSRMTSIDSYISVKKKKNKTNKANKYVNKEKIKNYLSKISKKYISKTNYNNNISKINNISQKLKVINKFKNACKSNKNMSKSKYNILNKSNSSLSIICNKKLLKQKYTINKLYKTNIKNKAINSQKEYSKIKDMESILRTKENLTSNNNIITNNSNNNFQVSLLKLLEKNKKILNIKRIFKYTNTKSKEKIIIKNNDKINNLITKSSNKNYNYNQANNYILKNLKNISTNNKKDNSVSDLLRDTDNLSYINNLSTTTKNLYTNKYVPKNFRKLVFFLQKKIN